MITLNLKGDPVQSNWSAPEGASHPQGASWRFVSRPRLWSPPTDVYETEAALVVRVEIAGMQDSEFSISLQNRELVIRGLRPDDQSDRRAYHQMEIPFGEFRVEIDLPLAVVEGEIEANYRDGFLQVLLPKVSAFQKKAGDLES